MHHLWTEVSRGRGSQRAGLHAVACFTCYSKWRARRRCATVPSLSSIPASLHFQPSGSSSGSSSSNHWAPQGTQRRRGIPPECILTPRVFLCDAVQRVAWQKRCKRELGRDGRRASVFPAPHGMRTDKRLGGGTEVRPCWCTCAYQLDRYVPPCTPGPSRAGTTVLVDPITSCLVRICPCNLCSLS